jgi:urease accessory protein
MTSPSAPIPVRVLHPHTEPPAGLAVVELPMTAVDRRRVRRLVEAPDGVVFALELPTGTILHPRQLLYQDTKTVYLVSAADEDVLVIAPRDLAEAARVGHLIGNMHRDIHASGTEIIALADEVLADRLARTGLRVGRGRRPFLGRAPGEHSH